MTVFPAPAGMNRGLWWLRLWSRRVPRASGDEPWTVRHLTGAMACSPRQRG